MSVHRSRWSSYLSLLVLIVVVLAMIGPILILATNSFKTETEFLNRGPLSLPESLDLQVIRATWERTRFGMKFLNSLGISIVVSAIALGFSSLNGYALGIGRIRGRSLFLILFVLAITLPKESVVYPLYYVFRVSHLYGTRLSVVLIMATIHMSYGTYVLGTVFRSLPTAFVEAAELDGARKGTILLRVVLPLMKPTLMVLAVFFFIWTWNEFFFPLIFLISQAKQTVPLSMTLLAGQTSVQFTMQSAAALLATLPPLVFFLLFQRTLVSGITAVGIKG